MTPLGRLDKLHQALDRYRYRHTSELEFQDGIESALQKEGISFEREPILAADCRLDFLVQGDLAIEVKIEGSLTELTRQVMRYLREDKLSGLLVMTTRSDHRRLGAFLDRKPIRVLWVGPGR